MEPKEPMEIGEDLCDYAREVTKPASEIKKEISAVF
jgi:hypothetical protein